MVLALLSIPLLLACPFWVEPQEQYPLGYTRVIKTTYDETLGIDTNSNMFDGEHFYLGGDGWFGEYVYIYKFTTNGTRLWKKNIAELFPIAPYSGKLSTITRIEDRLYAVGITFAASYNIPVLYCLDLDGTPLYRKNLFTADLDAGQHVNCWAETTCPVLYQGQIVLPIGYMSDGVDENHHTRIYIINPDSVDGSDIWSRRSPRWAENSGRTAVQGNRMFIGNRGHLRVLDMDKIIDPSYSDDEIMQAEIERPNIEIGGVTMNVVYHESTWITYAMDVEFAAAPQWMEARYIETNPAAGQVANEIAWKVDLVDIREKDPQYIDRYLPLDLRPFGNISIHGNSLFVPGNYGDIACIDLETKTLRWVTRATIDYMGSNLYARGVVLYDKWYVQPSFSDQSIFVFDIATGETLLRIPMAIYAHSAQETCWVHNDLLYILAQDGFSAIRIYEK